MSTLGYVFIAMAWGGFALCAWALVRAGDKPMPNPLYIVKVRDMEDGGAFVLLVEAEDADEAERLVGRDLHYWERVEYVIPD